MNKSNFNLTIYSFPGILLLALLFSISKLVAEDEERKVDESGNEFILQKLSAPPRSGYQLKVVAKGEFEPLTAWSVPSESITRINVDRKPESVWPDEIHLDAVSAKDGVCTILSFQNRDGEVRTLKDNDFWLIRAKMKRGGSSDDRDAAIAVPDFIKVIGFDSARGLDIEIYSKFELTDPFVVSMFVGRGFMLSDPRIKLGKHVSSKPAIQLRWPEGVKELSETFVRNRYETDFKPFFQYPERPYSRPSLKAVSRGKQSQK